MPGLPATIADYVAIFSSCSVGLRHVRATWPPAWVFSAVCPGIGKLFVRFPFATAPCHAILKLYDFVQHFMKVQRVQVAAIGGALGVDLFDVFHDGIVPTG